MTRDREPTLYEILDVPEDATEEEIERAYRIASATYTPGSAAVYSVFSDQESAELLRQVEQAFRVLSNPGMRREYDASGRLPGETASPVASSRMAAITAQPPPPRAVDPPSLVHSAPFGVDIGEPEDGIYDGPAIHRFRVSRGIELEEVSSVTKINTNFLRFIEGDRYELLPAPVYVKGFVREIARMLRLDPARVSESYMKKYRESTGRG